MRLTSVTAELRQGLPDVTQPEQHPVRPSCELSCHVAGHSVGEAANSRGAGVPSMGAPIVGAGTLRPARAAINLSLPTVPGRSPSALDAVLSGVAKLEAISGRPSGPSPRKTPSQIKSVRQHAAESRQRLAT